MNFKRFGRTANLFDKDNADIYISALIDVAQSQWRAYDGVAKTVRIACSANTAYAMSIDSALEQTVFRILLINTDNTPTVGNPVSGTVAVSSADNTAVFTTLSDTKYIVVQVSSSVFDDAIDSLMMVEGSTPQTYQPYKGWNDVLHYIHKTDTDTITTPAVIYANGTTATIGLKGDMVQSGTPTPTTPIQPQETGESTGNLLDYTTVENTQNATATDITNGISVSGKYFVRFRTVKFIIGQSYTMAWTSKTISGKVTPMWRFQYSDNTYSSLLLSGESSVAAKEVSWLLLYVNTVSTENGVAEFTNIMLNTGSTALPYEPYGVKIPILSNSTTTPVYLGEVESTRKIKKYIITGNETDLQIQEIITATNAIQLRTTLFDYKREPFICSHMTVSNSSGGTSTHGFYGQNLTLCFNKSMGLDTLEKMRTYLQQQYAAGTPVTIWYVLAESTTGIVNESLRKIGDYADEVSGISIPVTAGANTLSVDTTLQPSEITANYHGWHPVVNVHERENGAWD